MSTDLQPVRIFIAYSHKDLVFKDEIRRRLKPLVRAGKVSIWDNYNIEGGGDWDADIREKLSQADIILLLLSPDALDSDYFYEVEAPIALQRHQTGEAIAVGIKLRPCTLKHTPFENLERYELLPKKGYPVTDPHWHHVDAAYLTIFEEIDILVEKVEGLRLAEVRRLQRQQECANLIARANIMVGDKKWTEAIFLLDNALIIWETGFDPAREELEKLRKKCAIELSTITESEQKKREEEGNRQREKADHNAWKNAHDAATEGAYQDYIQKYPLGIHLAEALVALHDMEEAKKEAERKKQVREDTEQRTREAVAQKQREQAEKKKSEEEESTRLARLIRENDPFVDLMIPIKGGSFNMGDTFGDGDSWEKPVHRVTIRDFHLCKYPVTQAQWKAIMGDNPAHFKGDENLPIEQVSWDDAQNFIKKLNEKTGKKYRLPSEAEWEYAAREGGKKIRFGNGQEKADPKEMNFDGREENKKDYSKVGGYRQKTTVVNAFSANALGLHDMSGNVWEWCQDVWHESYKNALKDGSAWEQGGHASLRVVRGGSWSLRPNYCRAACRGRFYPVNRYNDFGFRLAR